MSTDNDTSKEEVNSYRTGTTSSLSSPLSFKAGGNKKSKSNSNSDCRLPLPRTTVLEEKQQQHLQLQPTSSSLRHAHANKNIMSHNNSIPSHLSIVRTGISHKRSPLQIKNWITCVLTLDGRDKFTKLLQYTSRLLCWYFTGLAKQSTPLLGSYSSGAFVGNAIASDGGMVYAGSEASLLGMLFSNIHMRQKYYSALAKRFDELYKSLVTSRKAFRLGRSIIELDKLSSMGWGEYLTYMLLHPLAGGVADGGNARKDVDTIGSRNGCMKMPSNYITHPIQEENGKFGEEEEEQDIFDELRSYNDEEKKSDTPSSNQRKAISRPGRPKLLSKVSSNIGWGPSLTATSTETVTHVLSDKKATPSSITPTWKLIGGTIKLLGLMGFWAFDNISFLTGSGFLDPICGVNKSDVLIDPKAPERTKRKAMATEWAARCYFLGSLGGFYYNVRALLEHRKTKFIDACNGLQNAIRSGHGVHEATAHLEQAKQQQFELWVALLKSCADVMVFSNNPGVDLHLKYRGKKNHEGLHCLGGLISASTVLYANFPNV